MNTTLTRQTASENKSIPFDFTFPSARQVSLAGDFNNYRLGLAKAVGARIVGRQANRRADIRQ